jgi:putative membrane protein
MAFLSEEERQQIEAAVAAAETRTAAELVTVIARASGNYLYLPTLTAAVATLLLSGLALAVPWPFTLTVGEFYAAQVCGFIALNLLCRWRPLRHRLVPRGAQRDRARLRAHQLFLDLGLAATRDRTGVLFYVSVAERYVEIITDRGVRAVVDDTVWARTVADFTLLVRQGRIAEGFLLAIGAATDVLAERLPVQPGDRNELSNQVIEI